MGSLAQVHPSVVAIERHDLAAGHLALRRADRLDDLALERLVLEASDRVLTGDLLAEERLVLLDDPAHLGLDPGEVAFADRRGQVEVVVEAVLDRRSDRVFRLRMEPADRLGEHVRGGVSEDVERVVGPGGDRLRRCVTRRHEREIAQLAVHTCRKRVRRQHGADRLPLGELDGGAVRKGQARHVRHDIRGVRAPRRALLVGDRFQDLDPRGTDRRPDRRHEPEDRSDHREREQETPRDRQT